MSSRHQTRPAPDPEAMESLLAGYATHLGSSTDVLTSPLVTVHSLATRAGTSRCSVYLLGRSITAWCDPAIAERAESILTPLRAQDHPRPLDLIDRAMQGHGSHEGRGLIHVAPGDGMQTATPPAGLFACVVDPATPEHMALLRRFVATAPADATESAEIDLDHPDPHIELVLDRHGTPISYASWLPWATVPAFADIGVATLPSHRRRGAGVAAVVDVAVAATRLGLHPVYRCDTDNDGSRRLALSAGFVEVCELSAWILNDTAGNRP